MEAKGLSRHYKRWKLCQQRGGHQILGGHCQGEWYPWTVLLRSLGMCFATYIGIREERIYLCVCDHLTAYASTVIWEMFIVKLFLWCRWTIEIQWMKICSQQTFRAFNFCQLLQSTKIFQHKILHARKKIFWNTVCKVWVHCHWCSTVCKVSKLAYYKTLFFFW